MALDRSGSDGVMSPGLASLDDHHMKPQLITAFLVNYGQGVVTGT
jgi:hypothetical protein